MDPPLAPSPVTATASADLGTRADDVRAALQRFFGFPDLRPGQAAALAPVLDGRDALVVMPTGAGKSLVYQLGAL